MAAIPVLFAPGVGGKILKSILDDERLDRESELRQQAERRAEEERQRAEKERQDREALEQYMRDL